MENKFKESLKVKPKSSILGKAKYPNSKNVKLPKGSSILGFAKYPKTRMEEEK